MDFDIERLEHILSPYIVLRKKTDIVYLSDALTGRTGLAEEDIRGFIETSTRA